MLLAFAKNRWRRFWGNHDYEAKSPFRIESENSILPERDWFHREAETYCKGTRLQEAECCAGSGRYAGDTGHGRQGVAPGADRRLMIAYPFGVNVCQV